MGFYDPARIARRRERQSNFGRFATSGISKIFGMGDYTVSSNSLMSGGEGSSDVPQFGGGSAMRSVRIQHREYLQDVSSTTGFQNISFAINPANTSLFPWLSSIAQNFQEFKIHGMVLAFNSLSSDALNSTNTALGAVIMSTDYNAANPPFASKQAAENAEFTVSCKPSCSLQHGIECDPSVTVNQGHLYISPLSTGAVPPGQDIKTYNLGTFQFMTQGSQANATIGELWNSYDIELIKPIDNSQLNRSAGDKYTLLNVSPGNGSAGYLFGSGGTGPNGQNAVQNQFGVGTILSTQVSGSASTITFPANAIPGQNYLISYLVAGEAVTSAIVGPTISFDNCVGLNLFLNDTIPAFDSGTGLDAYFSQQIALTIGPGATLTTPASVSFASPYNIPFGGNADLFIIQIPALFRS